MTELDTRILAALAQANALTVPEICRAADSARDATQRALHALDDAGHVFLRNGFYRLSEAARAARRADEVCDPPTPDCVIQGDDDFWMVDR